jgi:hypothetical protein
MCFWGTPMIQRSMGSGAEPKPSGPLISVSLILMIPPRLRSRGLCQPPSFPYLHQALPLDTATDRCPVLPGQRPGIPQVATFDRTYAWQGIEGPNPEALMIEDLRVERRLLGAASIGPIDMGRQAMSVARVGLPHVWPTSARIGSPLTCSGICERAAALRRSGSPSGW